MKNQPRLWPRLWPVVFAGALAVASVPGLLLRGGDAMAQAAPPDEEWRQIFTPHFVVTFPQGLDDLAERAAVRAERAYEQLADRFVGAPPGRVQLLLTDHADISNGFARPVPFNQITIFARPPTDGGLAYYDDWLELVITHELVHTFHIDMVGIPGRVIRTVFGRIPSSWPVFPSAATPTWLSEGIATYFESSLTGAGRTKGTWQEMVLRAAALEGELASVDRVSGSSPVWPAGNRPYVYGARYFEYLAQLHGEQAIGSFARSVAGLWVPYRLNAAARRAFGGPVSSSWEAWHSQLTGHYRQIAETLAAHAPLTEGEAVDGPGRAAGAAVVSGDGRTLAFVRSDGVDKSQIRLADPDGSNSRLLTRINGPGGSLGWGPAGSLVFSQLDFADRYTLASDLYMAQTAAGGAVTRLTRGQRLAHPDLSPDGERIVAVQEGDGTRRLAVMDLATGELEVISEPQPDEHWAYPRWSPDGRHIAAVRWRRPTMMDIVVLRPDGTLAAEITADRAVDTTPFWTPDGRFLLWSSDRTGIPNIFVAPFVPEDDSPTPAVLDARVRQVTNMLGGATHPTMDPNGEWIYFSSYHADGWALERIPFDPETWFDPLPVSPRFAPQVPEGLEENAASEGVLAAVPSPVADAPSAAESEPAPSAQLGPPRNYDALPTLRPYYWMPLAARAERSLDRAGAWSDVIRPAFGVRTGGSDLVGRHAYAASARLSLDRKFSGGVGYSYRGLGNPDLGVSFSQEHSAYSRTIGGGELRGEAVREYFLLERERRANLSVSFQRRRYRTVASLALNGGVAEEQRTLQDLSGSTGRELELRRPESRQMELGATLSFSNAQQRAFSFSREDGVSLFGLGRWRRETGLDAAARGVPDEDLGYTEFLGEASAYKAIAGPGFANHVLAARISAGMAFGPGAHRSFFDAGGAEGRAEAISGFGLFGGSSLFFPLRGYPENIRSGRKAWTASAEYRFPLLLADRGLGSLPLFLDRLHGSVFLDAGNAWGPAGDNPRQPVLASAGIELSAIVVPFYVGGLTLRGGVGIPMRGPTDPVFYLRAGNAF